MTSFPVQQIPQVGQDQYSDFGAPAPEVSMDDQVRSIATAFIENPSRANLAKLADSLGVNTSQLVQADNFASRKKLARYLGEMAQGAGSPAEPVQRQTAVPDTSGSQGRRSFMPPQSTQAPVVEQPLPPSAGVQSAPGGRPASPGMRGLPDDDYREATGILNSLVEEYGPGVLNPGSE